MINDIGEFLLSNLKIITADLTTAALQSCSFTLNSGSVDLHLFQVSFPALTVFKIFYFNTTFFILSSAATVVFQKQHQT